ncbi:MAG: GH3 auxin-responsive promoter family protein [Flavobacteriales bacterium]
MSLLNSVISWFIKKRIHQIELFKKYPVDVQMEWLRKLVLQARNTEWGIQHNYRKIENYAQFKESVPVQDYESLKPWIERTMRGESNLLWHSEVKWFAKSSGTTSDKSKFIPMTQEALDDCHFKCGKDMLSIYCNNYPETKIFSGKSLTLGGSHQANMLNADSYFGDLSAIIMQNLPIWAEIIRTPDLSIALMGEWEEKLERIAHTTIEEDVTNLAGVPSWMLILLQRVLKISGVSSIHEIWPNLELFMHGGVNFAPYREQYKQIIQNDQMHYMETYNASEGFFAIQDQKDTDEMLLMLDYGIFYEFVPMDGSGYNPENAISLEDVALDTNYALLISTNGGLWRYMIGDTIQFTSLNPFRIKITGRTKHFINTFGEELIVDNAEKGLEIACEKTAATIKEYTAGPIYMKGSDNGAHEWLIEFERPPENLDYFTEVLDNALKTLNSDYEAKRYKDITLRKPIVRKLEEGSFYNWMKIRGKLGGQNKVPRLSNDRKYLDEILEMMHETA